jgi:hypothetical protein
MSDLGVGVLGKTRGISCYGSIKNAFRRLLLLRVFVGNAVFGKGGSGAIVPTQTRRILAGMAKMAQPRVEQS